MLFWVCKALRMGFFVRWFCGGRNLQFKCYSHYYCMFMRRVYCQLNTTYASHTHHVSHSIVLCCMVWYSTQFIESTINKRALQVKPPHQYRHRHSSISLKMSWPNRVAAIRLLLISMDILFISFPFPIFFFFLIPYGKYWKKSK